MLRPLSETLAAWSPQEGGSPDPLLLVAAAWPEVVGADVARHSQPTQISGNDLIVATRSSAWSEQLSFLSERILASLRERFGLQELQRLRFRVGRIARSAPTRRPSRSESPRRKTAAVKRDPAASAEDAVERFRAAVARSQRAKLAAGWKQCNRCTSFIPSDRATCTACANAAAQERERLVARLLFEVPWLGFAGISALVEGLQRDEYEAIRARLLAAWWETLLRARRAGRVSRDRRERLVASSFVIVKSGLDPERIAPATMRSVLGDDIFDLLYDRE